MKLPEYIQFCMEKLNNAGYEAYCVGGCVRDFLLGLTPHDYDLCTNAKPETIAEIFADFPQVLTGMKHGTVAVILDHTAVEITTFRTEGGYADHRHPDWVKFVPAVEEDLSRRDFTVNAMAYSPERGIVDPWGGQADLKAGFLRAVGDPATRFREDALRILRGVRFAGRFHLEPEKATYDAMLELAPSLEKIAPERIFDEMNKLLPIIKLPDLLRYGSIFAAVIPEIAPTIGFDQHSPHHAFDLYTHIAHVTAAVPAEPAIRWAALLHDLGKVRTFTQDATGRGHFYGHAQVGAEMADEILRRLKAPNALREQAVLLIGQHMNYFKPEEALLRRWLSRFGSKTLLQMLAFQRADFGGKGVDDNPNLDECETIIHKLIEQEGRITLKSLAVSGGDLQKIGIKPGPAMGKILNALLEAVLAGTLPNDHNILLQKAQQMEVEA